MPDALSRHSFRDLSAEHSTQMSVQVSYGGPARGQARKRLWRDTNHRPSSG